MRGKQWTLLFGCCLLVGCNKAGTEWLYGNGSKSQGRYSGIGTFDPGRLWEEMKGAPTSKDAAAATLADDEHIIVVLDSQTGEIRQCGDHSGFCVTMNPWAKEAASVAAPVLLTNHAADLNAEAAAPNEESKKATPAKPAARQDAATEPASAN